MRAESTSEIEMPATVDAADGTGAPSSVPPSPRRRPGRGERASALVDRHVMAFYAGPAITVIIALMVFPVLYTLYLSLNTWSGGNTPPRFVGVDNFVRLLTSDSRFMAAAGRTLLLTVGAVGLQTIIGVGLAVLMHREFVGRGLVRSLVLLPLIVTPVAISLVWQLMFNPQLGILNEMLKVLGLPASEWLANSKIALVLIGVVDTWEWAPLIALITLAGLSALPEEPSEAASIDGAGAWKRFWYVTLPMVRPIVVVAVVFRLIESLKTFDIILVMTNGGPGFATETLNIYAYNVAFQYQQIGYSAALLIVYFLLILLLATLILRLRRS